MLQRADVDTAAESVDVMAAAAGDLAAFERLYRQFSPRVYGLCLRLTGQREAAEDWRRGGGGHHRERHRKA